MQSREEESLKLKKKTEIKTKYTSHHSEKRNPDVDAIPLLMFGVICCSVVCDTC